MLFTQGEVKKGHSVNGLFSGDKKEVRTTCGHEERHTENSNGWSSMTEIALNEGIRHYMAVLLHKNMGI